FLHNKILTNSSAKRCTAGPDTESGSGRWRRARYVKYESKHDRIHKRSSLNLLLPILFSGRAFNFLRPQSSALWRSMPRLRSQRPGASRQPTGCNLGMEPAQWSSHPRRQGHERLEVTTQAGGGQTKFEESPPNPPVEPVTPWGRS